MANHPIPDNVPHMMNDDFGTSVLITDPKSDIYLEKSRKTKLPDRMSRWCGGAGGFDDYVERWH
jgi:hypothetical protein